MRLIFQHNGEMNSWAHFLTCYTKNSMRRRRWMLSGQSIGRSVSTQLELEFALVKDDVKEIKDDRLPVSKELFMAIECCGPQLPHWIQETVGKGLCSWQPGHFQCASLNSVQQKVAALRKKKSHNITVSERRILAYLSRSSVTRLQNLVSQWNTAQWYGGSCHHTQDSWLKRTQRGGHRGAQFLLQREWWTVGL